MKKAIIYLNLVLFLIFIINLPAIGAATTVTLNPTEDAGISLNEPDSNFGEYVGYTVWEETYGYSENWGYKIYLKFGLSSIPSSATIESATLSLYAFQIILGSEPYTIGAHYCSDNYWYESSITWNNAPSFSTSPVGLCTNMEERSRYYSWTVTNAVISAFSSETLTLVLNEYDTPHKISFNSKDHSSNKPELSITYEYEEENDPPEASFYYSPSNPTIDDTIQFTDYSTDADGTIVSWSWSFGDGYNSIMQNPQHQFSSSGNYTVSLTITDDLGDTDTIYKTVRIRESESSSGSTNEGDTPKTPGFETFVLICAFCLVIILMKKKKGC